MFFLALIAALLVVPAAIADHRRGVRPYDRLGRHIGTDGRHG